MEIEFLRPDGTPEPVPEEVLEGGPPRRPRRRPTIVVVLVGVALVAAGLLVGALRSGHNAPPAARLTHPATLSGSAPAPPGLSIALDIPNGAPAVEVDHTMITEVGGRIWWQLLDGTFTSWTPVDDADGYQLIADPARHQLWVLLTGSGSEVVLVGSEAGRSPGQQADFPVAAQLAGGALLDGRLYVTTDRGVGSLSGHDGSVSWTPVRGGRDVAADPTRHRLLLVDLDGAHASVRAQRPTQPSPQAQATLPFGKGTVVVADGQIWAAGYGDSGAVLARLDPSTLRVVANSPAAASLGPGAQVVGVGRRVLLVRSGGGGDGLWCVDARTGAVDESWPSVPGAVGIGPDGGYELATTGQAAQLLTGGRCPG